MRLLPLLGTGLLLAAASASGALAQNTRPDIALSTSPLGITRCSSFLALGPGERDSIVRRMVAMAPASSLASTDVNSDVEPSGEIVQQRDADNQPPLSSGRLVSACQGSSPSETLRDAYAHSNPAPEVDEIPSSN